MIEKPSKRLREGTGESRRDMRLRVGRPRPDDEETADTGEEAAAGCYDASMLQGPSSVQPSPAHEIRIEPEGAGQRIDNFLLGTLKGIPKSHIYRILRRGEVRVNRGRIRQHYRLRPGDRVRIPPLRSAPASSAPGPGPGFLDSLRRAILYEDELVMALDKPAGVAVHGGSGQTLGLIEGLRCLRPELRFLDLAHRLDRETSGLLLVAKRRRALTELHRAFREGDVEKRYFALVRGRVERRHRIEIPLWRGALRSGERVVRASPEGRASRTDIIPIAWDSRCSLVEARPRTGRTHQIRVHSAESGHPVGGDPRYGDRAFNRILSRTGLHRMFLHAHSLRVRSRLSERPLVFAAPLPPELRQALRRLDLHIPAPAAEALHA